MTDLKNKHLYLVDGSGFIFRAFHAVPPLTRPDNTPINAVYGFTSMLMKLLVDIHADYLAVIFDTKRKTFRNDIYADYKAHRPPPPEELIPQFPLVRDACKAFNIPALEMEGYEADDLIASYAKEAQAKGMKVTIVSSDKDLMQLVSDHVDMFDAMKNKQISIPQVIEKFGVHPDKVIDVLALAGDAVDNVPGVPGIGVKTAAQLIDQYGDLEGLLSNLSDIKQPKRREKLENHTQDARTSYELVKLKDDVTLPAEIDALKTQTACSQTLVSFLKEQGFHRIIDRLARLGDVELQEAEEAPQAIEKNYTLIQDEDKLAKLIEEAFERGLVCVDTETTSVNAHIADLVGVSLCLDPGVAYYIPLQHKSEEADLLGGAKEIKQISLSKGLEILKPLLESENVLKVGQNLKYDKTVLRNYDINLQSFDDTMVMSYALDGAQHRHNMDDLAELHLGLQTIKFSDIAGSGKKQKTFDLIDIETARDYACEDVDITLRLYQLFKKRLIQESAKTIYETLDRPLVNVLEGMESEGIQLDVVYLKELSRLFSEKIVTLEDEIFKLAGCTFNVGSPKQLGEVLFESMQLPGGKKGKTGAYSTSADVLEKLAEDGHEVVEKILQWRQFAKLKSTYTDSLIKQINPKTGRVHTSYHMAATSTGRLSSSDPNLQNIPTRTEEGRYIRKAFVPKKDHVFVSFDYSQIELRLLAHMGNVDTLKDAFKHGEDIHKLTASQVFQTPLNQVSSELRRRAKAINFGIIYGISAFGLAKQLDVSNSQAKQYIEYYLDHYPGIQKYMEDTKSFAVKQGYVETLLERKCYIPGIQDKNPARRAFAERQAINAPLQGTNADLIKKAMIKISKALEESDLRAKMLLQVHDELIFEAHKEDADKLIGLIKPLMESVAQLSVPLTVDAHIGNNWAEAK